MCLAQGESAGPVHRVSKALIGKRESGEHGFGGAGLSRSGLRKSGLRRFDLRRFGLRVEPQSRRRKILDQRHNAVKYGEPENNSDHRFLVDLRVLRTIGSGVAAMPLSSI